MIVEDDEGIRDVLKFALELEGYTVTTAANGKEVLDILPQMQKPCLILYQTVTQWCRGSKCGSLISI